MADPHELQDRSQSDEQPDVSLDISPTAQSQNEQMLYPADSGYRAWLVLAGCFIINVLIWGTAPNPTRIWFRVLLRRPAGFLTTHEPFSAHPGGIPIIGTVASGLMYLLMPMSFALLQRYPRMKRYSTWASLPLISAALIGASFAQTVTHLVGFQGVLYAIGGNLIFTPTVTYLDEWFVRRKGLAIGIMWAGDGVGGVVMPLLLQTLLTRFGYRNTLRGLACAMVVVMAPLLAFLRPRLPISKTTASRPVDVSFLRNRAFWILQAFNIVRGTGYFLPSNYLPAYAHSIGISSNLGSLMLVLVNVASVAGCVVVGALVDRIDITSILLGIGMGSGIAIFAVWGVSGSLASLSIFALLYGATASTYSTAWSGIIKEVQPGSASADGNVVLGFLAAGRGIGAIASGPLSEAFIAHVKPSPQSDLVGYTGRFGPLIILSGSTALAGGLSWFVRKAKLM